ncbi:hypothetical protein [uncultured Akkermansia sp.]|jgi:hypothetical protein|uniref:hypothetical protein n=1 Tax=uncultured Akkermansia sp. TaxID=512294 RepID=UPI0026008720|nr:hypothetical protein [uncultured Akkermansia sp.]
MNNNITPSPEQIQEIEQRLKSFHQLVSTADEAWNDIIEKHFIRKENAGPEELHLPEAPVFPKDDDQADAAIYQYWENTLVQLSKTAFTDDQDQALEEFQKRHWTPLAETAESLFSELKAICRDDKELADFTPLFLFHQ